MQLKLNDIPEEIIIEYKLQEIATEDGYVYCEIQQGMYGLLQAGIIMQDLLQERLAKVGYHQSKIIPGLWTPRKKCFTLVVDNFTIKYASMEEAHHLIDILKQDYTITIDWDATKYIGLTLKWDYKNQKVYAHMPGYNQTPKAKQNSLHPHIKPQYEAKAQYSTNEDTSLPLSREEAKICARSNRHINLLCQGSGQHNSPRTHCNCHQTSKSNRKKQEQQ